MKDEPISLDGRRTEASRQETELRRRSVDGAATLVPPVKPHLDSLEGQMQLEPAESWIEVMEKSKFLLDRYAATPEACDDRIQKLIGRAIGDMERLRKRLEPKSQ